MKFKIIKSGMVGAMLLLMGACDEGPPPALTSSQREWVDTLYLRRVSVLRPQLDSLCDANFTQNVQRAVDSLIEVRKAEAARLRERILQQQPNN